MVDSLDMARLSLEIAVDQLTLPEASPLRRDDGSEIARRVPALLVQLDEARGVNSGTAGAFVPRSKPPVWIDAVSLLAEIDRWVMPYGGDRPERTTKVRAWSGAMHALTDRDDLESCVLQAEDWVRRARALLDPTPPVALAGECPQCERSWLMVLNDEGETVRRRPLRASESPPGAWCEGCASRWQGEGLWLLADQLRTQTEVEHLGVEHGPTGGIA